LTVRTILITQIHSVGRIKSFSMLKQVVNIAATSFKKLIFHYAISLGRPAGVKKIICVLMCANLLSLDCEHLAKYLLKQIDNNASILSLND
jgi:hypothetical protein